MKEPRQLNRAATNGAINAQRYPRLGKRVLRLGIILTATGLLGASCQKGKTPLHTDRILPIDLGELDAQSYGTRYASSLKSSRVLVSPGIYETLDGVPIGWEEPLDGTVGAQAGARSIAIAPDGGYLLVHWGDSYDLRDATGHVTSRGPMYARAEMLALNTAWYWSNGRRAGADGGGAFSIGTVFQPENHGLALRVDDGRFLTAQDPPPPVDWVERTIQVTSRATEGNVVHFRHQYGGLAWRVGSKPHSTAAISSTWHTVLANEEKRLWILGPEEKSARTKRRKDSKEADVLWEKDLDFAPHALSIVPPYIVVTGHLQAGTVVVCLDSFGQEQWRTYVPFHTGQPPIDGAEGRIYLAGRGLAAVAEGRVVWSIMAGPTPTLTELPPGLEPPPPLMATAFQDGTLAVAHGPALRIVRPDGTIVRELRTSGERLTCPPAIGPDGSIWVGSDQSLYVARPGILSVEEP